MLIGRFPEVSIEDARRKTIDLCAALARGEDPFEKKRAAKKAPLFGELLDAYLKEYASQRCLAYKEIAAVFRRYLSDWGDRQFDSITKTEVLRRVNDIGQKNGHVPANHTITYTRAAINWCIKNGLITGNNPWAFDSIGFANSCRTS